MNIDAVRTTIEDAWERRQEVSSTTQGLIREAVTMALGEMDAGRLRVAEKADGRWVVHQWLKKAVLLSFRLNDNDLVEGGPGKAGVWFDKVASKFEGWSAQRFR